MSAYVGISDAAKSVSKIYVGVDGKARRVYKGYVGVDGKARQFLNAGVPLSSLALGTTINIANTSGGTYAYKLIQKGTPGGGMYDSTANGAWLWRTDNAGSSSISSNYIYGYEGYALDSWCNNYPSGNIKSSIVNQMMTVHLPYMKSENNRNPQTSYGSNGLSRKCFLLSVVEMGVYTWQGVDGLMVQEGAKLDYFDYTTAATDKRSASAEYWTRTMRTYNGNWMFTFYKDGSFHDVGSYRTYSNGVRPCIVLPLNTIVSTITLFTTSYYIWS